MSGEAFKQAQEKADRLQVLREELGELERREILTLTAEQRTRLDTHLDQELAELRQRFEADTDESARRLSWGIRLATLLGTAALFAALVLFLHRVWGFLPLAGQISVLVGLPVLGAGAAEWTRSRGLNPYFTALTALAAAVALGFGLAALGTVLNRVPTPHAMLAWLAFALLLGGALSVRLLFGAGLVAMAVYLTGLALEWRGAFWGATFEGIETFIPVAAAIYALPSLLPRAFSAALAGIHRIVGAGIGLFGMLLVSLRGVLHLPGFEGRNVEGLAQLLGLITSVVVVAHGLRLRRGALVNLGTLAFVLFLFLRLHAWWWHWMPKYLFCLCLSIVAFGALLVFRRLRRRLSEADEARTSTPHSSGPAAGQPGAEEAHRFPDRERPPTTVAWFRRLLIGGAIVIVLVTHGIGLLAARRNAASPVGGSLSLSHRDFRRFSTGPESSVVLLHLRWRTDSTDPDDRRSPDWLTAEKCAQLGLPTALAADHPNAARYYQGRPPVPVWLVLELQPAQASEAADASSPSETGLVVVDAGTDPVELRARYSNPRRHALVRGLVRCHRQVRRGDNDPPGTGPILQGRIDGLLPDPIFVARPQNEWFLRHPPQDRPEAEDAASDGLPTVTVCWGSRGEPWVADVEMSPAGDEGKAKGETPNP